MGPRSDKHGDLLETHGMYHKATWSLRLSKEFKVSFGWGVSVEGSLEKRYVRPIRVKCEVIHQVYKASAKAELPDVCSKNSNFKETITLQTVYRPLAEREPTKSGKWPGA